LRKQATKNEEQEGKAGAVWGWVPLGGGGHKERVKEGEYSGCILYFCIWWIFFCFCIWWVHFLFVLMDVF
jgi:hypothetical protein